jgi:hypothetical protein
MAVERRAPLDLLDVEYAFSQRRLLDAEHFIQAAEKRGVRLTLGHLEALHRSGDLVPLFRIHQGRESIVKAWEPDGYMVPSPDSGLDGLRGYAAQACLTAGDEPFTPWARHLVSKGGRLLWVSTFLYSPWQLLALVEAKLLLPTMRRIGKADFGNRFSVKGNVFMSTPISTAIIGILSALEPMYWPDIIGSVRFGGASLTDRDRWFETYLRWLRARKADDMRDWLRMTPDEVVSLADGLVVRIKSSDPIDKWVDLVRMMSPDKWRELTGDARIAIDHRIAAEMLMRLRDDLTIEEVAPALPAAPAMAWTPQHYRLNHPMEDLDRVLTDYGISPHPSLVLPLEGATEMILVGRSMALLHLPRRRNYIELFDIGGNTNDYGLLARYVAVPELGREVRTDLIMFNRPVTRIMVVTDPENKLRAQEQRDAKRRQILESIYASLPDRFRTERAKSQLDSVVTIDTWTENESFEFAHFTDDEIAEAIRRVHTQDSLSEPDVNVAEIHAIRQRRGNLKSILRKYPALKDRKDRLADALWPTLRDRLDHHVKDGTIETIPIGRVLKRAVDMATMSFRRSVALEL